jgi:hypothetical protein
MTTQSVTAEGRRQDQPAPLRAYLPPMELRNIKSLGNCVYCGATSDLSSEHVVPKGMGGNVTLPDGSCGTCRKITHEIETFCMRETLIQVRTQLGLNQHAHERPDSFPAKFTYSSGREETLPVSASNYPTMWVMPIYEYPRILGALPPQPEQGVGVVLQAHMQEVNFHKLLALANVQSISASTAGIRLDLFTRWIAKIGYCYAVACLGLDAVQNSPLTDIVRNGTGQINYRTGGLNDLKMGNPPQFSLEPASNELFRVAMMSVSDLNEKPFIAVYVRPFPLLRGASYIAVVGENTQKLSLTSQPVFSVPVGGTP